MNCTLTVSIPAYNDGKSLQVILEDIDKLRKDFSDTKFKVLIIDDGSSDNTLRAAMDYKQENEDVEVVAHEHNLGFGPTFKEAFNLPDTEWIFFLPADNQFPVDNFRKMRMYMKSYDLILGKRKIRKDNLWRRTISSVYNRIISMILGKRIHDVNSTVLFKREINEKVILKSLSAFVNAEFVMKAARQGYRIAETDIDHAVRMHGCGSGGKLRVILPVISDILKYMLTKKQ